MIGSENLLAWIFIVLLGLMLAFGGVVVNIAAKRRRQRSALPIDPIYLERHIQNNRFFAYATIGGSLTSISAVFYFFLLNTNVFGYLLFVSIVTIPVGAVVAKTIQLKALQRCLNNETVKNACSVGTLAGVLNAVTGKNVGRIIRIISICMLSAFLWMEIKIVSMLLTTIMAPDHMAPVLTAIVAAIITFLLASYVFRFGMTGIVVSDFLYWPGIILCVLLLMAILASYTSDFDLLQHARYVMRPNLGIYEQLAWIINVCFLNLAIVSVRDDHWCRLPAFGVEAGKENKALKCLPLAAIQTATVGALLIFGGFLCSYVYTLNNPDIQNANGIDLLVSVIDSVPLSGTLILFGGLLAMLSTANGLIFALHRNISRVYVPGDSEPDDISAIPVLHALAAAIIVGVLTFVVLEYLRQIEFYIIFPLVNMPVTLMPGLWSSMYGYRVSARNFLVPLVAHVVISVIALFLLDNNRILLFLSAPLSALLGIILVLFAGKAEADETG